MPIPFDNVKSVFDLLVAAKLTGGGPPAVPWGNQPTKDAVIRAIDAEVDAIPFVFRRTYADPLRENMGGVIRALQSEPELVETLAGAIYDHGSAEVAAPLNRFLAVVSNLYRSFLSAETRTHADLPLIAQLPPMAMFQHSGSGGPFTLPSDVTHQLFGSNVGVVSLPSACRDHPFTWASLAHETGGHDVLHADTGLLDELSNGVLEFFGVGHLDPNHITGTQVVGLLWAHWMDEAASDVYGLMNIGPAFGINLVVFLAAFIATFTGGTEPVLRNDAGRDPQDALDVHPVDLLRPHLAIGAIQALTALAPATRQGYDATLEDLAARCSAGATTIDLAGTLPVGDNRAIVLQNSFPLADMQDAARRVGSFIATAKLHALDGHGVQDLETWDDADEAAAKRIEDTFKRDASAVGTGDDAQLLAAATLAIMDAPASYDTITKRLNEALDHSFAVDPIWGTPQRDLLFVPVRPVDRGYFLDRYSAPVPLLHEEAPKLTAA